ncbi:MAG: protoheme IX farnesyltransferase [Rubrivivax sp.]|nr:protoheme IX farnesyltransferase [Rubrivivax sp.]
MTTPTLARPEAIAAVPRWRTVISVFKLRIGVLIMLTALGGMLIAPGPAPAAWQVVLMALAVLVSSASAGAFNQFVEADSDRLMKRTRGRAFASGALHAGPAWMALIVGLLAAAVAATWAWVNGTSALFLFLGAVTYAVVYTVGLKRRTWDEYRLRWPGGQLRGAHRRCAVDPSVGPQGWLLALVLFLWTPPHFWSLAIANRDDYAAAGIPMLPVFGVPRAARIVHVNTIALVAASPLPLLYGAGPAYAVAAVVGGAHFLRHSHRLARDPQRRHAMGTFFASMVQLALLIGGWRSMRRFVDRWRTAALCAVVLGAAPLGAHAQGVPTLDQRQAVLWTARRWSARHRPTSRCWTGARSRCG